MGRLIQRLKFDDGGAVVAAYPERDWRRRTVHKHSANVRRLGQKIFGELAALRIEPRDAIVEHRPGPGFAVFVYGNIVGVRPRRWHGLKFFALSVEDRDLVAAILTEPKPVLCVHHAAAWPRTLGGRLEHRDLAGLRINPADMLPADVGEISVVLGVGDHVIDVVPSGRLLERVPGFPFTGFKIDAVHAGESVVLCPHLAVHADMHRARHIDLRIGLVQIWGNVPDLECLGLLIEFRDARLVHHAQPQVLLFVETHGKRAGRGAFFRLGYGVFHVLARFGIEPAQRLLAEIRIPGDSLRIDDYVMRLYRCARQVVLRYDNPRGFALGARQRLDGELPRRRGAQIDGA